MDESINRLGLLCNFYPVMLFQTNAFRLKKKSPPTLRHTHIKTKKQKLHPHQAALDAHQPTLRKSAIEG